MKDNTINNAPPPVDVRLVFFVLRGATPAVPLSGKEGGAA